MIAPIPGGEQEDASGFRTKGNAGIKNWCLILLTIIPSVQRFHRYGETNCTLFAAPEPKSGATELSIFSPPRKRWWLRRIRTCIPSLCDVPTNTCSHLFRDNLSALRGALCAAEFQSVNLFFKENCFSKVTGLVRVKCITNNYCLLVFFLLQPFF